MRKENLQYTISDTRPLDMVIIEKLSNAVKDYKEAWIDCKNAENGKIPRQLSNSNFYHDVRSHKQDYLDVVLDELDDIGSMGQAPVKIVDTFMAKVNDPLHYLLRQHYSVQDFDNSLYVLDRLYHFLNTSKANDSHEHYNQVQKIFDKVK